MSKMKEKLPMSDKTPLIDHIDDKAHMDALKHLKEECMEVEFSMSWLPLARVVSEGNRNLMLTAVNARKKGISISKRMFCSGHPLLGALNDARTQLNRWRDSFVIVKGAEAADDENGEKKIVGGVRLIEASDIPEFESGFKVRVDQLYAAAAKVEAYMRKPYYDGKKHWPSILDADKAEVGDDFNEADYPANVAACVQVVMPTYTPYEVSIKLPPEVRKRQEQRLNEALNSTLETATAYITNSLTDVFTQFANSLVNRTRIYPKDVAFSKYHGAEIVTKEKSGENWVITLRHKEPDPERAGKERSVLVTLDPLSDKDFHTLLKPQSTDEKKKLSTSVLENIFNQFATLTKVKGMLGPYGDQIEHTLDKIRDVLSTAGTTHEEILKEAKNSNYFRNKLVSALGEAVKELDVTVQDVKRVRRKISSKLIGQV